MHKHIQTNNTKHNNTNTITTEALLRPLTAGREPGAALDVLDLGGNHFFR